MPNTINNLQQIIAGLNDILKNELTAINQYFLHARIAKYQGYDSLGKKFYEESIDEMKHADLLIERILFLGGIPNLQDLGKLLIGENVKEMLECDMELEKRAIPLLRDIIALAEDNKDYGTVEILSEILTSEEEHYEWIRKQLNIIEQSGIENYLQSAV